MTNKIKVLNFNDSIVTTEPAITLPVQVGTATSTNHAVQYQQMQDYVALNSGGGGSEFGNAILGESVLVNNGPKTMCVSQKPVVEIPIASSWIDINEGSGAKAVQILTSGTNKIFFRHDFGIYSSNPTELNFDLCKLIENALNNSVDLALTYTVSYSTSTRKITIAAGSNFSILWNSGSHNATNIGLYIGFVISSDDTSASSFAADYEVMQSNNPGYKKKAVLTKTDATYQTKSSNFSGVVETVGTKGEKATCSLTEIPGFSGLTPGEKYFTKSAQIVIGSTNNKIDFNEGGGALVATITSGTYYRGPDNDPCGFRLLCSEIVTRLQAAGTKLYACYYDKNNEKITIKTTNGTTLNLLFLTGTNNANTIATSIGYTKTDKTGALTYTSENVVSCGSGELGLISDSKVTLNSVYAGFATEIDNIMFAKGYDASAYEEIYKVVTDWLTTPTEFDFTPGANGIQLHDICFNESGYAGILVLDNSNNVFKIRYKKPNGVWTTASTTIPFYFGGSYTITDNFSTGNTQYRSYIKIDSNGYGVLALCRLNMTSAATECWKAYSSDLDSWTYSVQKSGADSYFPQSIDIRENKCVILSSSTTAASSQINISDNSGSGYTSWAAQSCTNDFGAGYPGSVKIQYFAEQTGINKYKIITIGVDFGTGSIRYNAYKGDGTSEETGIIINQSCTLLGVCQDKKYPYNRIAVFATKQADLTILYEAESTEVYGTLSWNNHSEQDLLTYTVDTHFGYSSTNQTHGIFTYDTNCVLYDDFCYFVHPVIDGSNVYTKVFWSKDITSGTWQTPFNLNENASSLNHEQQACAQYIPASNYIVFVWKQFHYDAAWTEVLTEGKIFARIAEIGVDGNLSLFNSVQIDGGENGSTFNGYLKLAASNEEAFAAWEYNTGTNNKLRINPLR